jgi:hypothetical protein
LLSFHYYSQEIENVDFVVKDNIMHITYDLVKCPINKTYDIRIMAVADSTMFTEASAVSGNLKKVGPGKNKKVEWNVLKDVPELKGKILVMVEVISAHSAIITDGPKNVFLSMILPGAGDCFVNEASNANATFSGCWPYVSAAYLLSVVAACKYKISSDAEYKKYHKASHQSEIDDHYNTAVSDQKKFVMYSCIAASIWLTDVTYVAIRGFKNKRSQTDNFVQNDMKIKLYLAGTPNNLQIGFIKKF